jgi:adenylate cyclase
MQRRLAAIVSADVQGYSRLMGEDESATVRTLTEYRELMGTLIREHGGRVVDSPGDNLLAEFPSAVNALHSAAAIQQALAIRNEPLPAARRMQFRIGINLGDVIAEGERIYGDGVNIAARVQDLAEAGGICISGTTYDQVENKVALHYESIGEHAVKNIVRPVRAYRVGPALATEAGTEPGQEPAPPDIPSIAVLPFDNMSDDPGQDYFSDGIVEDLITDLSKVSGLFVIARNSTFSYKGKAVRVRQVGRELGVRYVLEGSVRKIGDRVRITGQLIDAGSGHHLWADRYDRRLDDVFAVQDEITRHIVDALAITLTRAEQQQRERRRTDRPEAYDCFLRGIDDLQRTTHGANLDARRNARKSNRVGPAIRRGACPALAYLSSRLDHGLVPRSLLLYVWPRPLPDASLRRCPEGTQSGREPQSGLVSRARLSRRHLRGAGLPRPGTSGNAGSAANKPGSSDEPFHRAPSLRGSRRVGSRR